MAHVVRRGKGGGNLVFVSEEDSLDSSILKGGFELSALFSIIRLKLEKRWVKGGTEAIRNEGERRGVTEGLSRAERESSAETEQRQCK